MSKSDKDTDHKCGLNGDVMLLGPEVDGGRLAARHTEGHQAEVGVLRPVVDGKPVLGELVSLKAREDGFCDVESLARPSPAPRGPARVSSPAYRNGWGRVFGGKKPLLN